MITTLRAAVAVPVLALAAVLTLASCSGGGSAGDATSEAGSVGAVDREAPQRPGSTARPGAGTSGLPDAGDATTARKAGVTPLSREVISTGQISLRAPSLAGPRADVLRLVEAADGRVTDEQTDSDDRGRLMASRLTLRVPTVRFSAMMESLAEVAAVEHQSRTSQDVTTEVIDNEARVRAAERSIRQVEALLGRAEELADIIAIEADLTRRQSDLDSLKSQQAWLDDQTSLSTISVTLNRSPGADVSAEDERGFLVGLEGGWTAFAGAAAMLLTALGAALPFAALLVVLVVVLRVWLRRRGQVSGGSAPARSA